MVSPGAHQHNPSLSPTVSFIHGFGLLFPTQVTVLPLRKCDLFLLLLAYPKGQRMWGHKREEEEAIRGEGLHVRWRGPWWSWLRAQKKTSCLSLLSLSRSYNRRPPPPHQTMNFAPLIPVPHSSD